MSTKGPDRVPAVEVKKDLQRVAKKIGGTPTESDYSEHGKHTHNVAELRFGSFTEALEAAGLEPENERRRLLDDQELMLDLVRVADELGKPPTVEEYDDHGVFSPSTFRRRFFDGFGRMAKDAHYMAQQDGGLQELVAEATQTA